MLLLLLFAFKLLFSLSTGAEVLLHPKSRLVAIGVEVTFHCKINNSMDAHWVINNENAHSQHQIVNAISEGFTFDESFDGSVVALTLRVNATEDKNGTEMFCYSPLPWASKSRSSTAVLMIIDAPPISPNPSIKNPNASLILLQWSPPFLWPGQAIDYYDVFVTNKDAESWYYLVNTTYSDPVVSFTANAANFLDSILSCNDFHFSISAVSSGQSKLPSFTAIGGYIPSLANESLYSEINITVLYGVDKIPVVFINIEMSQFICNYQELNYTIILTTNELGKQRNVTNFGPFKHYETETISRRLTSALIQVDSEYTLVVLFTTITGSVSSDEYFFDTHFQYTSPSTDQPGCKCESSTYLIVMGTSIGIATLMILIVVFMSYCTLFRRRGKNIRETMVDNPIYEGLDLTITASRMAISGNGTTTESRPTGTVAKNKAMNKDCQIKSTFENAYMDSTGSISDEYTTIRKASIVVGSQSVRSADGNY